MTPKQKRDRLGWWVYIWMQRAILASFVFAGVDYFFRGLHGFPVTGPSPHVRSVILYMCMIGGPAGSLYCVWGLWVTRNVKPPMPGSKAKIPDLRDHRSN